MIHKLRSSDTKEKIVWYSTEFIIEPTPATQAWWSLLSIGPIIHQSFVKYLVGIVFCELEMADVVSNIVDSLKSPNL